MSEPTTATTAATATTVTGSATATSSAILPGEPGRYLAMLALFVLGLMGGIWTVIAPFVLNWPSGANGSWTDPIRDTVITGAVLAGVSAVAIVLTAGFAARAATQATTVQADPMVSTTP